MAPEALPRRLQPPTPSGAAAPAAHACRAAARPPARTLRQRLAAAVLLPALALALACPAPPAQAQISMPALGGDGDDSLPVSAERRLGEQTMREVRRDPAYLDDPVLLAYVQSIWAPLRAAAERRGDIGEDLRTQFPWEVFLVRDRSVNAFALPGGYVGVHLGLIAVTGSRDELASVLAHELSHVSQRHIARSVGSAGRQSALGIAAMILGVLAASRANNADMAQAAIVGGQAAMIQGQLNFSRDMEREADRIGFGVLRDAGFAPAGMARMFEKLDQASRLNDSGLYPYLRSHPLTIERVSEARARVGFAPAAAEPLASDLHPLMQARARVLMEEGVDGWRRLAATPATSPLWLERVAALYAAALAQVRLQDFAAARRALDELELAVAAAPATADPSVGRWVRLLRAEVELEAGAPARAAQALGPAGPRLPERPELLLRARTVLAAARVQPAPGAVRELAGQLQTWVAEHRADALAWEQLAQAQELLGNRLAGVRARAEVRAALGDLGAAADLLRAARRSSQAAAGADFIEASVIDARLRELDAQRRQIAQDMRAGRPGRSNPEDPDRQDGGRR